MASNVILGFEPAVSNNIIHSRHGNRWYDIEVTGREAHSGRCNGEELNAAHEMSHKINEIINLTNEFEGTKVNIGAISSDSKNYNVVCGKVSAKLDLRFADNEVRDLIHKKIVNVIQKSSIKNKFDEFTIGKYSIADDCPAFGHIHKYGTWIDKLVGIIEDIEKKPIEAGYSGGASDVNYMFHNNCFAVDGLGVVGEGMHTRDEKLFIPSLVSRSTAVAHFLEALNTQFNWNV